MKISHLLNEDGGYRSLSVSDVRLDLIDHSLREYFNKNARLYRGVTSDDEAMYFDPHGFTRKSRELNKNYYTVLFDGLPSWKGWPKRSNSVICSTYTESAKAYSDLSLPSGSRHAGRTVYYHVFPIGNPIIGICPSSDLWHSFADFNSIADFNKSIEVWAKYLDVTVRDTSYENFITDLDKLINESIEQRFDPRSLKSGNSQYPVLEFMNEKTLDLFAAMIETGRPVQVLNEAFNPVSNGFTKTRLSNLGDPHDKEVWFSSPCYLIRFDVFEEYFSDPDLLQT